MLRFFRIIKPVCAWEGGRLFTCDTEFPLGRFCLSSLVSSHSPLSAREGRAFALVASGRLRCSSAKAVGSRRGKATDDSDWVHLGLMSIYLPRQPHTTCCSPGLRIACPRGATCCFALMCVGIVLS